MLIWSAKIQNHNLKIYWARVKKIFRNLMKIINQKLN